MQHAKRVTLLAGHYGSGKTNIAVNLAMALRQQYDRLFFLVPGYGAQGGTAKHVSEAFTAAGRGAIVSASRSVIGAWQKTGSDGRDWARCAKDAACKMRDDLAKYVTVI